MSPIEYIAQLHLVVDQLTAPLTQALPLRCGAGCADCCVDGLTVHPVEAALLRQRHAPLFAEQRPHPPGACALLDEHDQCRVYADRPYVCRTQGLPLRWAERRDGQPVEARDICPINGHLDVTALPPEACWTIGPIEQRIAALGDGERVPLRSLFARGSVG